MDSAITTFHVRRLRNIAASAAVLLATALVASFYPAWRAATTDPTGALREE